MTLDGVTVSKVGMGVYMEKGSLTIRGNSTIEFKGGGVGVYVGSEVKSASLTGTKIMGQNKGVGVYATGGEVTLSGVEISGVITGVKVEKGSGMVTVNNMKMTGVVVGIDMKGSGTLKVKQWDD